MNNIYELLIELFLFLVKISSSISLYITIPKINIIFLLGYFLIIYIFLKIIEERKIKRFIIIVLLIYISIWLNIALLDIYDQIIFFDLPNGESTLIHGAFNKYNILVDTGDIPKSDNPITSYLRKKGIRKLDFVIITHSDSDHIGGLETIMKEIKVNNIITNYYEKRSLFNEYKKINTKINIYYLKKGNDFTFKKVNFKIISPLYNLGDVNNNSLVFLLTVDNIKILFTGDIEEKGEKQIEEYIECDILKIAHHGSKTSTTKEFLEKVKYDTAIIMNGYQNIFDFPTDTVIRRIKNKKYYVTGWQKTIIYQKLFFKDKFNIMICFPKPQ
jgi:competence protein ComEC